MVCITRDPYAVYNSKSDLENKLLSYMAVAYQALSCE